MRQNTKEVKHDVDGKEMTFQLKKLSVIDGVYLSKVVAEKIMPIFDSVKEIFKPTNTKTTNVEQRTDEVMSEVMQSLPKLLSSISKEDLETIMGTCLRSVSALLPAGWQPVMIGDRFCVEEVEYDIAITLALCYEVMEFNLGSFFGGSSLTSLFANLNTSPRNA